MNKVVIKSRRRMLFPDFKELGRYKDLFYTLSWRDFKVRYAQTSLGLLWALIQPIVTLLILSLVFGKFAGVDVGIPHILFTVAGTSLWSYFSFVLTNSGNSIIVNQGMIKKIYFPRLIIPLSKAVVGLIDFGISLLILSVLMVYYGVTLGKTIVFAPLFVVFGVISALAVGIWVSALTVRYRDIQHMIPFVVQIGLYITPIAYPSSYALKYLPSWAQKVYFLNPMAGVIQGFRWSLFGGELPGEALWYSVIIVLTLLISGLAYFNKVEREMADFI